MQTHIRIILRNRKWFCMVFMYLLLGYYFPLLSTKLFEFTSLRQVSPETKAKGSRISYGNRNFNVSFASNSIGYTNSLDVSARDIYQKPLAYGNRNFSTSLTSERIGYTNSSNASTSDIYHTEPTFIPETILNSNELCRSQRMKYILYVYSTANKPHEREVIRQTWGDIKRTGYQDIFQLMFVLGKLKTAVVADQGFYFLRSLLLGCSANNTNNLL